MLTSLRTAAAAGCALAFAATASSALAKGTVQVQESNGSAHVYGGVWIAVIDHRALRITSADRRGTLVVTKGACSFLGELERCLPYRIVLDQSGVKRPIDFERGTEYLNRTDSPQMLPYSTMHVPPHGIVLSLVTAHGTSITVRGTVDRIVR